MRIRYTDINEKDLKKLKNLKAGQWITYTGSIITLRDSSQLKLVNTYNKNKKIPIDLKNKIIMYAAPTDSKEIIIGPTTSKRMDGALGLILGLGVASTIGKGGRSKDAEKTIKKFKAPYLILMSGVSAYLSRFFSDGKIIAFPELGAEAIRKYTASKLPLLVGIDSRGKSIF